MDINGVNSSSLLNPTAMHCQLFIVRASPSKITVFLPDFKNSPCHIYESPPKDFFVIFFESLMTITTVIFLHPFLILWRKNSHHINNKAKWVSFFMVQIKWVNRYTGRCLLMMIRWHDEFLRTSLTILTNHHRHIIMSHK